MKPWKIVAASLLSCLAMTELATAEAIYVSEARSVFTLLNPGGMALTFETGPEPSTATAIGNATASVDGDFQSPSGLFVLPVGGSVLQISAVSGSADGGFGKSDAMALNGVLVTLDNSLGLTDAVAVFRFDYSWDASYSKTDVSRESVDASPFFHLSGFAPSGGETLEIDSGGGPVAVPDWLVSPGIGSPFGDGILSGTASGSDSVLAYVTVPAGGIDQFSVITDSFGAAIHTPEPASCVVWFAGLAAVTWRLRRKRPLC